MKWSEHILALRSRLIRVAIVFVVVLIAAFALVSKIFHYLIRPLTALGQHLIVTSPGEIVIVFMSIALVTAVAFTLPYLLYELWTFASPGLTPNERTFVLRLLPFVLAMFIAGVCFAWFVAFPLVFTFLVHLTERQGVGIYLRADAYFSFLTMICIPFGLAFEMPVAVLVLSWLGLITPKFLQRIRKYAYFAIVVIGVLISPPELVSHLSVTVPMAALYELSILIALIISRRQGREKVVEES